MFKESQEQSFFPSDTLINGISRDGSKNFNIRTFEHMTLSQLRMGARQTKNAPLALGNVFLHPRHSNLVVAQREKIEIEILRVWTMEAWEGRRSDLNLYFD